MEPLQKIKAYYQKLNPEIDDSAWKTFEPFLTVQVVEKGEKINQPGQIAQNVSFVDEGMILMYVLMEDKQMVLEFFEENCYCSEYESFLTQEPSSFYLEATERTVLVNLNHSDLQQVYALGASFEKMGRLIAENLFVFLSHKNKSLLTETPEERYAKLLEARPVIFQKLPQYLIASYLGITPESLSRIRKRMVAK